MGVELAKVLLMSGHAPARAEKSRFAFWPNPSRMPNWLQRCRKSVERIDEQEKAGPGLSLPLIYVVEDDAEVSKVVVHILRDLRRSRGLPRRCLGAAPIAAPRA